MDRKKTQDKKKAKADSYGGYILILIGLFIILFTLIGIAIGMIKKEYFAEDEQTIESETLPKESEIKKEIRLETESKDEKENDELLTLVNKEHPVSGNWKVTLKPLPEDHWIDERAYDDLLLMLSDAEKAGYALVICSSYRSKEEQQKLYDEDINYYTSLGYSENDAKNLSSDWLALPGTSEHELGLALDIVSEGNQRLEREQEDTLEQQWLMEHCYEYGFILRYPENKTEITGIRYEPWHYRYVGKEAAKKINEQGVCLEEYLME